MTGPQGRVELLHAGDVDLLGMLLEEDLAAHALRPAHQRAGAALQVRQHVVGHRFVVAHEVELGATRGRIDHALAVAHGDAADGGGGFFR
ncbi:hypothetical protein D3C72_2315240 [compost metagenome]